MKKHLVAAGVGVIALSSVGSAQANNCPVGGNPNTVSGAQANLVHDACLQGVDLFQMMAPQLGVALAGGNATLGQGGAMGGLGHFSVGIRGNVFSGDLPQVQQFPAPRNQTNPAPEPLPSKKNILGLPVVDGAFGLFKGIPLGLTNVGGIDALVSVAYVPTIGDSTSDVSIKPQTSIKWGYGARIGIIQESLVLPGVAVTYIKRDLPTTDIVGNSSQVNIQVTNADVKTSAWRLVASKSFIVFGLAGGVGQDKYDMSTTVGGTVKSQSVTVNGFPVQSGNVTIPNISLAQDVTRTNLFLDLSLNLPIFKLVIEGGQVSGASPASAITTTNTFSSGKADDSRTYGSVGLRFAW
ncbi:MAG TPA: hypothetical protein VN706_09300 [Gemmatimonadaceae bacterium]|nr:hypothetical protein [Gemmatimonadaceae bacterium]